MTNLNGTSVHRSDDGSTIFLPLPRALWRETECGCEFCRSVPGRRSYWDTLAIAANKPDVARPDIAWTIHRPAEHPERLRGEETER